jgi:pyridoxamine 5'-phosphate oxidase
MAIADLRREYSIGGLDRADLDPNPLQQFEVWFNQASARHPGSRGRKLGIALFKLWHALLGKAPADVNAMTLATVGADGVPSARTVLLKGVDARGFVFYTNYESRKGQELADNPNASLVFFWAEDERQICITGRVTKLPRDESENYFHSRPRGSQLGAWASQQSSVVPDRAFLERAWEEVSRRFAAEAIPLPPNWGGYVLAPRRVEFWQGRPSRLHDRFCYSKTADGTWRIERLSP